MGRFVFVPGGFMCIVMTFTKEMQDIRKARENVNYGVDTAV